MPSVPSAPINKCFRWYPVLSLRIPLRQSTICPLAKTYNADSTILSFLSPVKTDIQKLLQCIMQTFTKITNSSKQILIRHRASTSMYSLTFCTRVMLPERHQRKPAVMLRTPPRRPVTGEPATPTSHIQRAILRTTPITRQSPASSARRPRRAFALCRHIAGWTQACN